MEKAVLKQYIRLEQYTGFNGAALLSGGKYKKQITLIHILSTKGDDMPAFVWETWAEQFHRRRQEQKEHRNKIQKNLYKKLNTVNWNYWINILEGRSGNSSSKYPSLEQTS